jgi:hypothetical protein
VCHRRLPTEEARMRLFASRILPSLSTLDTSASASLPNRFLPIAEDDVRACSVPSKRCFAQC